MFSYIADHNSLLNLVFTAKRGIRSHPLGNLDVKNICIRNYLLTYLHSAYSLGKLLYLVP